MCNSIINHLTNAINNSDRISNDFKNGLMSIKYQESDLLILNFKNKNIEILNIVIDLGLNKDDINICISKGSDSLNNLISYGWEVKKFSQNSSTIEDRFSNITNEIIRISDILQIYLY